MHSRYAAGANFFFYFNLFRFKWKGNKEKEKPNEYSLCVSLGIHVPLQPIQEEEKNSYIRFNVMDEWVFKAIEGSCGFWVELHCYNNCRMHNTYKLTKRIFLLKFICQSVDLSLVLISIILLLLLILLHLHNLIYIYIYIFERQRFDWNYFHNKFGILFIHSSNGRLSTQCTTHK